jgi:hypothetical protein
VDKSRTLRTTDSKPVYDRIHRLWMYRDCLREAAAGPVDGEKVPKGREGFGVGEKNS